MNTGRVHILLQNSRKGLDTYTWARLEAAEISRAWATCISSALCTTRGATRGAKGKNKGYLNLNAARGAAQKCDSLSQSGGA